MIENVLDKLHSPQKTTARKAMRLLRADSKRRYLIFVEERLRRDPAWRAQKRWGREHRKKTLYVPPIL